MNCCGNNGKDTKHANKYHKHLLMMALCCGIPVLIILLLPYISKLMPGVPSALGSIVPLLCPVMMIGMMFMMSGGGKKADKGEDSGCHADTK